MTRHVLIVIMLWLAPPSVRADSTQARAKVLFQKGNDAFRDARYADALEYYRQTFQILPRPSVLYNIARCYESLADYDRASEHYRQFLESATEEDERRQHAEEKLRELQSKLSVRVDVSSDPTGAQVFVDGAAPPAGQTPLPMVLRPGPHKVRIVAEHFAPREIDLEARGGAPQSVSVGLTPMPVIDIDVDPADGEVRSEGQSESLAQGHLRREVLPGRNTFVIHRPGYADAHLAIEVAAGETVHRQVVLNRPTGTLIVHANVPGAAVFVAGLPVALAPNADPGLRLLVPEGMHQVSVEKEGFAPWHGQVRIAAEKTTTLDLALVAQRSSGRRMATWGLGGVGAATAAVGGVFAVMAIEDYSDYGAVPTRDAADRFRAHSTWSYILLGTGAVAIVGAALVRAPDGSSTARSSQ